jgi:hypothetical protein
MSSPTPDAADSWPDRMGWALDRVLNVMFLDGDDTQTVSVHAADAQAAGVRWGCVVCDILGHWCSGAIAPSRWTRTARKRLERRRGPG